MGFTDKKQSGTTQSSGTTASTAISTPNVPDWIAKPAQAVAGNISGLIGQGPGAYTPGTSALQQQAFAQAPGITTQSPYYQQAGDALAGVSPVTATNASAAGILDNGLDQYYNPFKSQVLNPVLADYDQQSGVTRAAQAAAAAKNQAFQGSRYGIQEANTEGQLARGRAATEGGLLNDMYGQATGLAEADTGRRQQVSLANAAAANQVAESNQAAQLQKAAQYGALGTAAGTDARANLGLLSDLGATQTAQENAQKQYPITFAQQAGSLLQGLNPADYIGHTVNSTGNTSSTGSSTSRTSDPLGDVAKMAETAAILFSDRRLKRDVKTVGWDARGRRWVTFAYLWEPLRRVFGVIAQEVAKSDPEAVLKGAGGYLRVDYGRLADGLPG
jgi:hypothetical protein